jgi:hypothetical protein
VTADDDLADRASRYLKAQLKLAGITYEELAVRLTKAGTPETKASVASKISRGAFAATFLIASLKAIGTQAMRLEDL